MRAVLVGCRKAESEMTQVSTGRDRWRCRTGRQRATSRVCLIRVARPPEFRTLGEPDSTTCRADRSGGRARPDALPDHHPTCSYICKRSKWSRYDTTLPSGTCAIPTPSRTNERRRLMHHSSALDRLSSMGSSTPPLDRDEVALSDHPQRHDMDVREGCKRRISCPQRVPGVLG
jgi:hypothetical protein